MHRMEPIIVTGILIHDAFDARVWVSNAWLLMAHNAGAVSLEVAGDLCPRTGTADPSRKCRYRSPHERRVIRPERRYVWLWLP